MQVGTLSIEMHQYQGTRQPVTACPVAKGNFEDVGVEVPGGVIAVQEDRLTTEVADRIATRGERECGTEDFVARADSEEAQAEVDGCGTAERATAGRPKRYSKSFSKALMLGPTVDSQLEVNASRT